METKVAPRTLKRHNPLDHMECAMITLQSPELDDAIHYGPALSLLSPWEHPPVELLHALYFAELVWDNGVGQSELLEIIYGDYLEGGASLGKLREISQAMSEETNWNSQRERHLHQAAVKGIINLYAEELTKVQESWKPFIPQHEGKQHIMKFLRSQLKYVLEESAPWGVDESLNAGAFAKDDENLEFTLRAHHLATKGKQFSRAMDHLANCYTGPTWELSNMAPMAEYLGSGEKARLLLNFTKLGCSVADSTAKAAELGNLDLRYAPLALNCHRLTLDSMVHFASLLEEYNEEWALAAMEWSGEGADTK